MAWAFSQGHQGATGGFLSSGSPGSITHLKKIIVVLIPGQRQARWEEGGKLGPAHPHPPLFSPTGIWSEGADGTDINAVARSHDGKLLASADDFGKVHLFSYPCCQPRVSPHPGGLARWG